MSHLSVSLFLAYSFSAAATFAMADAAYVIEALEIVTDGSGSREEGSEKKEREKETLDGAMRLLFFLFSRFSFFMLLFCLSLSMLDCTRHRRRCGTVETSSSQRTR